MARGHRVQQQEFSIEGTELNLVPYLDVMVNLIMFMLLTFQVSLDLRLIPYNPPARDDKTVLGTKRSDDEPPLLLSVGVTRQGFRLMSTDAQRIPKVEIPLKQGNPDYEGLTKQLIATKKSVPSVDEHLIVIAEPSIKYSAIVQTLDATRNIPGEVCDLRTKKGCLFPNVTLGAE